MSKYKILPGGRRPHLTKDQRVPFSGVQLSEDDAAMISESRALLGFEELRDARLENFLSYMAENEAPQDNEDLNESVDPKGLGLRGVSRASGPGTIPFNGVTLTESEEQAIGTAGLLAESARARGSRAQLLEEHVFARQTGFDAELVNDMCALAGLSRKRPARAKLEESILGIVTPQVMGIVREVPHDFVDAVADKAGLPAQPEQPTVDEAKAAPIGTKSTWGDQEMVKTKDGWVPVSDAKGGGAKEEPAAGEGGSLKDKVKAGWSKMSKGQKEAATAGAVVGAVAGAKALVDTAGYLSARSDVLKMADVLQKSRSAGQRHMGAMIEKEEGGFLNALAGSLGTAARSFAGTALIGVALYAGYKAVSHIMNKRKEKAAVQESAGPGSVDVKDISSKAAKAMVLLLGKKFSAKDLGDKSKASEIEAFAKRASNAIAKKLSEK